MPDRTIESTRRDRIAVLILDTVAKVDRKHWELEVYRVESEDRRLHGLVHSDGGDN